MTFDAQFTITVKLDVAIHDEHSSDELRDKISREGKKLLQKYLANELFDPEKKIIFEDSTFQLKKI